MYEVQLWQRRPKIDNFPSAPYSVESRSTAIFVRHSLLLPINIWIWKMWTLGVGDVIFQSHTRKKALNSSFVTPLRKSLCTSLHLMSVYIHNHGLLSLKTATIFNKVLELNDPSKHKKMPKCNLGIRKIVEWKKSKAKMNQMQTGRSTIHKHYKSQQRIGYKSITNHCTNRAEKLWMIDEAAVIQLIIWIGILLSIRRNQYAAFESCFSVFRVSVEQWS